VVGIVAFIGWRLGWSFSLDTPCWIMFNVGQNFIFKFFHQARASISRFLFFDCRFAVAGVVYS
jgi:hypothetical protein